MNANLFYAAVSAFLTSAALSQTSAQMVSGNDLVRIEVRVASEQDRKDIKSSSADTVTQHKTLNIALSGKPKSPETRTGKWTAYGHSAKGHDYTVLESGDFKIDLSAQGRQTIELKKITTTYTPEHSVVSRGRSGGGGGGGGGTGRSTSKAKKVEATGTKFAGYGVVIKNGGKVVGEIFDPAGLKAEVAK